MIFAAMSGLLLSVHPDMTGGACSAAENTPQRTSPRPNLDIMTEQLKQIGEEILSQGNVRNGDSLVLHGDSSADNWMIINSFMETFKAHQCHVFSITDSMPGSRYIIDLHLIKWNVQYENIFHTGIFGQKFLTRSISSQMAYRVTDGGKREIIASRISNKRFVDTVSIDDLPLLENRSVKSTFGVLPPDPFIDKVIEPFILIGAAGLAIYLLFHIRSS